MYGDRYKTRWYVNTTLFRDKHRTVTKLVTKFSVTDVTIKYPNISLLSSGVFLASSAMNCAKREHQGYSPVPVFLLPCKSKNLYI